VFVALQRGRTGGISGAALADGDLARFHHKQDRETVFPAADGQNRKL
jgi:hypothetical protein